MNDDWFKFSRFNKNILKISAMNKKGFGAVKVGCIFVIDIFCAVPKIFVL